MVTILIVVSAWLLLTATGWLVLAPLSRGPRDALLPAAPLFGVVLLVVVLHNTTLVMSVRWGICVVAAVLAVLAVAAFRRDATWWRSDRRAIALLLGVAACGVVPAIWALGPSFAVGDSNVVQPSANNDAFYYVAVTDWLAEHPATNVPAIGETPADGGDLPSYASARAQLTLNLRLGQSLTQAALTAVMGSGSIQTWYPLTALWVLLLPASGVAAARFFRLHVAVGLLFGLLTSVSALVIFQLASQNSDSLLGTALVPLALGAVVRAVGREPLVPPLLSAMTLTALVGTYTEFVPLIAPALVVTVLVRQRQDLRAAVQAALVIVSASVVIAPLVWWRGVRSLLFLGAMTTDNYPTSFAGVPTPVLFGRFLGVMGANSTEVPWFRLVVAGAVVGLGLVFAVLRSGRRWFFFTLIVVGFLLSVYMVTVKDRPYTQQRIVQLLLPLVLLTAAVGWDRLLRTAARRRTGRRASAPALAWQTMSALGLTGALVVGASNSIVDHEMALSTQAETRHVGPEFLRAAQAVAAVDRSGGSDVAVVVGDFFSQLWITDALRDQPKVSYPALYPSYQYQTSYWDGRPRRWLLIDQAAITRVDPDVVVWSNDRFALLDTSRGRAVVAVPADIFGQNSYLVIRSEQAPSRVRLLGALRPRVSTDVPPSPDDYGDPVEPDQLAGGLSVVRLDLGRTAAERVVLSDDDAIFVLDSIRFGRQPSPR